MIYKSPPLWKVVPIDSCSSSYESNSFLGLSHLMLCKSMFASFIGKKLAFNYFFSYILTTKCSVLKIFQYVLQW